MLQAALFQAQQRLERARAAVARLENFDSHVGAEAAWSDFLLAANGIYAKLEQGAKGCPKSYAWFGERRAERRNDELLQYLHQARNADEHGLGGTTLARAEFKVLEGKVRQIGVQLGHDREPKYVIDAEVGARVGITKFQTVKAVKSRGETFMPPKQHLNQKLGDEPTTFELASLALKYLEGMIAQASELPAL
jgi:hypothetical protein